MREKLCTELPEIFILFFFVPHRDLTETTLLSVEGFILFIFVPFYALGHSLQGLGIC